jgi:hypothetical protein
MKAKLNRLIVSSVSAGALLAVSSQAASAPDNAAQAAAAISSLELEA